MNRWGIPAWLELEVIQRDKECIYCGIPLMKQESDCPRGARASWEHIINDARIVTRGNIARCCIACNSSKGSKNVTEWLESDYCRSRGITQDTVALVVKAALNKNA